MSLGLFVVLAIVFPSSHLVYLDANHQPSDIATWTIQKIKIKVKLLEVLDVGLKTLCKSNSISYVHIHSICAYAYGSH